jgi:hypothetical protein
VGLWYQSTSKEYVEFLRDENQTNDAGQRLYDLWASHGRGTPVLMASDSLSFGPAPGTPTAVRALANPFRGTLRIELTLGKPAPVTLEIFDARGRRLSDRDYGVLGPGVHVLEWEGEDRKGGRAGAGSFWARVKAGSERHRLRVVRIQ